MPASVRSKSFLGGGTSIAVAKPAGCVTGDVLYGFHHSDDGTLASLTPPTGFTSLGDAANGSVVKVEVSRRVCDGSEGSTLTFTADGGDNIAGLVCVQGADTTTPEDAISALTTGGASATPVAPSISPTGADSLLLCAFMMRGQGGSNFTTFTPPSGMTEEIDAQQSDWSTLHVASLALSSSGATGTKTATADDSNFWITVSIAVKSAGGGGGATGLVRPSLAVTQAVNRSATR